MNIEDIEKKMTEEGLASAHSSITEGIKYGTQVTSQYSKSNSWFPTIYEQEKYRAIDVEANTREETGLNLSEQKELIGRTESGATDGRKQAETSIQPTKTDWEKSYSNMQTALKEENGINYSELIMPKDTSTTYWLASRCIYTAPSYCRFCVRCVYNGGVDVGNVYISGSNSVNFNLALFPVVSLSSELLETDGAGGFTVK